MTLSLQALAVLCALGVTVFAAVVPSGRREAGGFGLGLLLALALVVRGSMPDVVLVGSVTAVAAAGYLRRPGWTPLLAGVGGALAGIWMGVLQTQGFPVPVAVMVVVLTVAISATLARRRPDFAPEALREEALLIVAVLGAGVAMLPPVLEGWAAAANLSAAPVEGVDATVPVWTMLLVAAALVSGAAHAVWSRR